MQQQPKQTVVQDLPVKSLLEQTLQQIQNRVTFFSTHNISAENYLNPSNNLTVRSISQIITPLKYFDISETPLNLNLAQIYANEQNKHSLKWSIAPPSDGEDSINEQQVFQPSFKWLISAFVDPNLLQIDQPQPKRIQKGRVPEEWHGVNSLLLTKVSKRIYLKAQVTQIESSIRKKFGQRYSWLKFKRAKQVYYKGKACVILKFGDPNSASFVYYNYAMFKSNRDQFGQQCQIFRITKDETKDYLKQKNWVILLFRHLPMSITKEQLVATWAQEVSVKWIQEPVDIAGAKYTICRVSYLDQALQLCALFNAKRIKDAKVNIHPKSSKNWKAQQIVQQEIIEEIIEQIVLVRTQTTTFLEESY